MFTAFLSLIIVLQVILTRVFYLLNTDTDLSTSHHKYQLLLHEIIHSPYRKVHFHLTKASNSHHLNSSAHSQRDIELSYEINIEFVSSKPEMIHLLTNSGKSSCMQSKRDDKDSHSSYSDAVSYSDEIDDIKLDKVDERLVITRNIVDSR